MRWVGDDGSVIGDRGETIVDGRLARAVRVALEMHAIRPLSVSLDAIPAGYTKLSPRNVRHVDKLVRERAGVLGVRVDSQPRLEPEGSPRPALPKGALY